MTVVKLDGKFRGHEWRKAFASRLIQLRPDMNPDAADEVSDSEFLNSAAFLPTVAAERYADGSGDSVQDADDSEGNTLPYSQDRSIAPHRR